MQQLFNSQGQVPINTPTATEVPPQTPVEPSDHRLHPAGSNLTINPASASMKLLVVGLVVACLAGVATGFGTYRLTHAGGSSLGAPKAPMQLVAGDSVKNGDVFGSADSTIFKDAVEGYLEAGSLEGEGSHRLLRPGGITQTVYLTSTVTDLTKLEGMNVKVWGETFQGQKAGWLMDVGRVEVISTQGEKPFETTE